MTAVAVCLATTATIGHTEESRRSAASTTNLVELSNVSRGKQLPTYPAQLSEHLMAGQETIVRELNSLRRNVGHIKESINNLDFYCEQ